MDGMETRGKKPSKPLLPEIRCAVDKKRRYVSRFRVGRQRRSWRFHKRSGRNFSPSACAFPRRKATHISTFFVPRFPFSEQNAGRPFPNPQPQPSQAARKARRIIHGNRAAPFSATASLLTTLCACSPDKPRRIWKTTRGTPRNRRARRQATAGRDRRTSPP